MPPDQVIVSDTNRTPIVHIITWIALATSVLAFFAHAGLKLYISRSLSLEIAAGFFALIFSAAQSLAVYFQAANGFGKPLDSLSPGTVQSQFKAEYAATILFILAMCLSKLVIVAFIRSLSPKAIHHRIDKVLAGMSVLWTIGSVFSIAFACGMPQPWDKLSGKCFSRLNWWYAVSAFNIVTEVGLIGLQSAIAFELQLKRARKITIISIFLCRACVPIAIILHLIYLHRDSTGPVRGDLSLGYWRSAVCQQSVQSLAIVTTSLPYAKMFLQGLDSGMIRIDDTRRRGENYSKGSSGRAYALLDISSDGTKQRQAIEEHKTESEHTPNTGISQTKTWKVERELAVEGELSHKDNLGLAVSELE
ncbi:uncharacterized protein BDR25DRAFT_229535 [Lindgomyces ingoldianus]|uniref:Uncharacterized protein n=1 Tax=Lindgomyces ingoldianus TaxID=673940 RepID=A0ACB6QSC5_9PLEO|nr:uncharacterized protein BDR25DRAFT_229535 [Lindgomyces ingoldianus]KAF2469197.1 hypothetical protein BDR25DRAFT_229535 [Lindgomyces ingoldianus]